MTERYVLSIQDRRTGTVSRLSEQVIKSNEHRFEGRMKRRETRGDGLNVEEKGIKREGWTGYCEGSLSSNSIPRSNSPTMLGVSSTSPLLSLFIRRRFHARRKPKRKKRERERECTSRMCHRIVPFRTLTNSTFSFFPILSPYFRLRTFLSHVTPIRNELIVRYRNHPPGNVGLFYLVKFRRAISKRTMDSERKGKSTVLLLRGYGNTVVQNN